MRLMTWSVFAPCTVGVAVPLAWAAPHLPQLHGFVRLAGAVIAAFPFAVVAATAWVVRDDRRASRVTAAVAWAVLAVGVGGWWWAAQDQLGFGLVLVGLLFVPGAQMLLWLG